MRLNCNTVAGGGAARPRQFTLSRMTRLTNFLCVVLLCASHVFPQRLDVFLNTNDCFNCISAIDQLQDLSKAVPIRIICDESKKRFIPSLLAKHGVRTGPDLTLAYVPTAAFLQSAPMHATCAWMLNDSISWSFDLSELPARISEVLRTGRSYKGADRLPLAKGQILGDRLTIFPVGDRTMIVDYIFRKSYLTAPDRQDSVHLAEIEPDEKLSRQAVARMVGGLNVCDYLSAIYTSQPQFTHEVLAVNAKGGGFLFADAIHFMDFFHDGSPIRTTRNAYFKWMNGILRPEFYGCWQPIEPYLSVLNFGFQLSDSMLTAAVLRMETIEAPLYLLADWNRSGDSIVFRGFRPLVCPPALEQYLNGRSRAIFGQIREGYYVTAAYPLLYSLDTDDATDLGQLLAPEVQDWFAKGQPLYNAMDVLPCGDDLVMVLISLGGKAELAWIDTKLRRIIRRQAIPTDDVDPYTMRIMDDGRLIAFSKDDDALIIRQ